MRPTTLSRYAANQSDIRSHLFTVGQAVRRKSGPGRQPSSLDDFRITAMLPEVAGSLQYRIRNVEERHERVIPEDDLEAADEATFAGGGVASNSALDRIFGTSASKAGG